MRDAGGGMGTFAVQIAKAYGAEVTGVDSTTKLDRLRTLSSISPARISPAPGSAMT